MSTLDRSCPDMKEHQTRNFKNIDDGHLMFASPKEARSLACWTTCTPGINHISIALVLTKLIILLHRINAVVREKEGGCSRLLQLFRSYLMANATSNDQLSKHLYLTPAHGFSEPMTIKSASIWDLHTLLPTPFCPTPHFRKTIPSHQKTHAHKNLGCSIFLPPFSCLPLLYLLKLLAELLSLTSVNT